MMVATALKHSIIISRIERELYSKKIYPHREQIRLKIDGFKERYPDLFIGNRLQWRKETVITPPEVVIEVLSDKTRIIDLNEKKIDYKEMGVKEYIIISQDGLVLLYDFEKNESYDMVVTYKSQYIDNLELNFNDIFNDVEEEMKERFIYMD